MNPVMGILLHAIGGFAAGSGIGHIAEKIHKLGSLLNIPVNQIC